MKNPHRGETRSSWADLLKNKQSESPSFDSEQNQIMKNPHRREPRSLWADLPLDIQAIILGKLNFIDIIRFRAVCKNWQIPRHRIIKSKHHLSLPWSCKLSRSCDRLQCVIYDPHSRQITNTWKHVACFRRYFFDRISVYGSKEGWLIAGIIHSKSMFMYHPYSMEFISLPPLEYSPHLATFSGNPVSQYCQVFAYCSNCGNIYIYSYCLNVDNLWSPGAKFVQNSYICGLEYMNGKILCLFLNGITKIYSIEDRSWTLLDRVKGGLQDIDRLRLAKGEGDLLVAFGWDRSQCLTFYFDWSNTIWVQCDLQGSTAIFISGDRGQQTTVRRFVDCDDHDITPDCNLHFFDIYNSYSYGTKEPSYYSFTEMWKHFQPYLEAVFFIEPPSIFRL